MDAAETARLLTNANERSLLADKHEAEAIRLAQRWNRDDTERAAHHFVVAEALRGRARFLP